MDFTATTISYQQTGQFTKIIIDYLNEAPQLAGFFSFPVNYKGVHAAIENRQKHPVNRQLLTGFLSRQYDGLPDQPAVQDNIEKLKSDNTFSIVTAHQPNIFTGHLYFVYKILHVIRLAEDFSQKFPGYNFVPVFYMGSEDADLEELGHIFLNGEKLTWETKQRGAVGRMNGKGLEKIIKRLEDELSVLPNGEALIALLKDAYQAGTSIQEATLKLVHALFGSYGLVTVIPDDASLKQTMQKVFADDLLHQTPSGIVDDSISKISAYYKVQANPREINVFYLKDDVRERIVKSGGRYRIADTGISFSEEEILKELSDHPDRFSPNVILRGLFQEMILPDIAFVGGGGEMAYWLELKDLFAHYEVPFPMLILRNSFLFIEAKWKARMDALGVDEQGIFASEFDLLNKLVSLRSTNKLSLDQERAEIAARYESIKKDADNIDPTLRKHVDSLRSDAVKKLDELEKKMRRAERRKFEAQSRQIHALKEALFPHGGLQERVDNLMPYYAKYGRQFLDLIYQHSLSLEQRFVVLSEEG